MTSTLDFPVTPAPASGGFAQAELGCDPPARSSHGIAPTPRGVSAIVVQPDLGLDPAAPATIPTQAERGMATGSTGATTTAANPAAATPTAALTAVDAAVATFAAADAVAATTGTIAAADAGVATTAAAFAGADAGVAATAGTFAAADATAAATAAPIAATTTTTPVRSGGRCPDRLRMTSHVPSGDQPLTAGDFGTQPSGGGRMAVLVPASVLSARDREGVAAGSRLAVALSARDCQGGGSVSTAGAGLAGRSRSGTTSLQRARSAQSATQDERGLVPAPPPSALGLLAQAEQGLTAAVRQPQPAARFAEAYLCALRAAAALLAARGRPHRGRAKPTSVWTLLSSVAPEMREWAAFFASCSTTRAAVQAGITSRVGPRAADDLVRQSGQFIALVHRAVHGDRR